ncbi:magnesium/cobalt transporter CorA [Aridibaculum aurantiacum]|uniref:magnesium/cobalt transporter CorA n=1 Tax=Aridibaculum aurantiacum TaxID=2810307 RepID=UPI001A96F7F5|nr:magnesium/cobalt transporter CorA [Aridibaculum aurantiacum]
MRPHKYIKRIIQPIFTTGRTKEILHVNPTVQPIREEAKEIKIFIYNYDGRHLNEMQAETPEACFDFKDTNNVSWINIDGIRKKDVELICRKFGVHNLIVEDILSVGQRPKTDEIEGIMFCLLNMLYFNDRHCSVEQEQISIVLGKNFVLTFQEDASRDVFDSLREKLRLSSSKIRHSGADYLCYSLIDMIVDHYFVVMESLGEKIEQLEEEIIRNTNTRSLAKINSLRKELIVLKRNVSPVRDLVNGFIKSESELLEDRTTKYFKDVYDHIVQANDLAENYRDMMTSLQDLYLSKVNLKMNEVMKVMAVVTCLLAPATVIGGIFGMNFDIIPYAHNQWGFHVTVGFMLLVPVMMLFIFKRRGWF